VTTQQKTQQRETQRAANRSGSQQENGGSTAAQGAERSQPIAVQRDNDAQVRGALAQSRGGLVGYGPSGTSQALMRHMADDIDQLLQLFGFGGLGLSPAASQGSRIAWSPQIEVGRQNGNLVVRAEVPGVAPDDVEVAVDDGVLTISGERRDEQREERDGFFRTERFYGQFYRAIPLPEGAKEDQVEANIDNGVLEIRIPVPEQRQRQPHRVAINSGANEGAGDRQQERSATSAQGGGKR